MHSDETACQLVGTGYVGETMTRAGLRAGCLALLLISTPAAAQRSSRRVLGAADIAAGGWHRLGDVVAALVPGSMATVDGFNALLSENRLPFAGLSAAGSPAWMIRVDGQRIPVAIDGMWILDALPVAMTQVDSVVVSRGPAIVDGRASLLGTLDVYTRRPRPGISAVADYQHGDESGDPGPYRYTPRVTPNVEKLGPFTSGAVAYANGGWSLDGAARYSSLNITDTRIARRFPGNFSQLQSDVNASGGSVVLSTSLGNGVQQTLGGRGRFTGLLWVPSLRREEQVRVVTTHAGSSGTFQLGTTSFRYGGTSTLLQTNPLGAGSPLPFTIGRNRGMSDAFVEVVVPRWSAAVGVGVNSWWLERIRVALPGPSVSNGEMRNSERLWIDFHPSSDRHGATVGLQRTDGEITPSFRAWSIAHFGNAYEFRTSVASVQRLANGDGAWVDQALTGSTSPARNTRLDEIRLEIADQSRSMFTPSLDLRLSHSPNWQLNAPFGSGAQSVQVLTFGAGVETKAVARIAASARAEASAVQTRNSSMQAAMRSTPAASLRGDVSSVVMTNFHLAASARFTTATTWPTESVFGEAPELPALRRIDLSANKPFWHEKIQAQLVVRNLFATDERYHPVGASWNWRTHLALTVALPPYRTARAKP